MSSPRPTIDIDFNDMHLSPAPDLPLIRKICRYRKWTGESDPHHGARAVHRDGSFLDPKSPLPSLGLVHPIAVAFRHRLGAAVHLVPRGTRPRELAESQPPVLREEVPANPLFLDYLRNELGIGLVRHGNSVKPIECIAQAVAAFPERTFAIVVNTRAQVDWNRRKLLDLLPSAERIIENIYGELGAQTVIGTPADMADNDVAVNKRDFLFFPDARNAIVGPSIHCLLTVDSRFRVFGFLSNEASLSNYEEDAIGATFGFHCLRLPAHGQRVPDILVRLEPISCGPRGVGALAESEVTRVLITRNDARSRVFATKARSLMLNDGGDEADDHAGTIERPVIVVASNLDHVARLLKFLPDWPIFAGDVDWGDAPLRLQRQLRPAARAWPLGTNLITTADAWRHYDFPRRGEIFWAAGGRDILDVPSVPVTSTARIVVHDAIDRFHPQTCERHQSRLTAYRRADIPVVGDMPIPYAIRAFLRRREVRLHDFTSS